MLYVICLCNMWYVKRVKWLGALDSDRSALIAFHFILFFALFRIFASIPLLLGRSFYHLDSSDNSFLLPFFFLLFGEECQSDHHLMWTFPLLFIDEFSLH